MDKQVEQLLDKIRQAIKSMAIEAMEQRIAAQEKTTQEADFWADNERASDVSRELSHMRAIVTPWRDLEHDVLELLEMCKLGDKTLETELSQQLASLEERYQKLEFTLLFSGPYDDHSAIVSIHAGTGGIDAMDWAEILERMYLRYGERSDIKTEVLEEAKAEEAGIKHAILRFDGAYAFGQLKSEHGVHRLVRRSPFNADHLRQTSFALVEVLPEIARPDEVEIDDKDLKIDVYRSGGSGGQSVNTTDSAVRITHVPTGITVSIQNERSQLQNKQTALKIIRSKLLQLTITQHKEKVSELKGPDMRAEWGQQIRNYVLHPYTLVKDVRTNLEMTDVDKVFNGQLEPLIAAYLEKQIRPK